MSRNLLASLSALALIAVFTGLTGCTATGPIYQGVERVEEGKALVYIYRPPRSMGSGVTYHVHVGSQEDDNAIVKLQSGGYFPYIAQPGETEFWAKTESTTSVTLDLKQGETHYIKGGLGIGFFIGRPKLSVVDNSVGASEIKECVLLEPITTEKKE